MSTSRVSVAEEFPELHDRVAEIEDAVRPVLGADLAELVRIRASYLNGCAFCVDLHTRTALRAGESRRRLFLAAAWREAGGHFTAAERAALALADEVTALGGHGVSDRVYAAAAEHYSEREVAALIVVIGVINMYNRVAVATGMRPPG